MTFFPNIPQFGNHRASGNNPTLKPQTSRLTHSNSPPQQEMPLENTEAWVSKAGKAVKDRVRWKLEQMPLRIKLDEYPFAPVQAEKLLHDCLSQWVVASKRSQKESPLIEFEFFGPTAASKSSSAPEIQIHWRENTTLGRDYETGHAERKVSKDGWIESVEITLVVSPVIDRHLSKEQQLMRLQATFLHEIGHALGLEHSSSPQDVMYYRGWQNNVLGEGDVLELLALYQQP